MYVRTLLMCTMVLLALLSHIESRPALLVGGIGEGNVDLSAQRAIRSARSPADAAGATTAVDDDEDDDLTQVVNDPGTVVCCAPEGCDSDDMNDEREDNDERTCD